MHVVNFFLHLRLEKIWDKICWLYKWLRLWIRSGCRRDWIYGWLSSSVSQLERTEVQNQMLPIIFTLPLQFLVPLVVKNCCAEASPRNSRRPEASHERNSVLEYSKLNCSEFPDGWVTFKCVSSLECWDYYLFCCQWTVVQTSKYNDKS